MQLQNMTSPIGQTGSPISRKLTIVIPVRIDSEERKANLKAVLLHIYGLGCRVLVLEADSHPRLDKEEWMEKTDYTFVKDESPVFHRTRYINKFLRKAETEIVSVWDADMLVSYEQVDEAMSLISQGCTIAYPYNGECVMLPDKESDMVRKAFDVDFLKSRRMKSVFGRKCCGGVFLVHRKRYLGCGGENENFTGWGPEDAERLRRVCILGHKACWIKSGQAYHLYHPRGKNSDFYAEEAAVRLRKELCRVCSMERDELKNYIETWKWAKTTLKQILTQ